jgi:hypothetical protein
MPRIWHRTGQFSSGRCGVETALGGRTLPPHRPPAFAAVDDASLRNHEDIFSGTKCVDRYLNRRQGIHCVFEYPNKRDLTLFAFAFGVAGCLMIWTINLSIDRLLFPDWDRKVSAPIKLRVQSPLRERNLCHRSQEETPRTLVTTMGAADVIDPCLTAELEPRNAH